MNREELDNIQELIERKILLAEVTGGLSSSDKKFISLWNYAMQLQNNWNKLKKWMNGEMERFEDNPYTRLGIAVFAKVLDKMQELENNNDNNT